jgi:hypothetical protein
MMTVHGIDGMPVCGEGFPSLWSLDMYINAVTRIQGVRSQDGATETPQKGPNGGCFLARLTAEKFPSDSPAALLPTTR